MGQIVNLVGCTLTAMNGKRDHKDVGSRRFQTAGQARIHIKPDFGSAAVTFRLTHQNTQSPPHGWDQEPNEEGERNLNTGTPAELTIEAVGGTGGDVSAIRAQLNEAKTRTQYARTELDLSDQHIDEALRLLGGGEPPTPTSKHMHWSLVDMGMDEDPTHLGRRMANGWPLHLVLSTAWPTSAVRAPGGDKQPHPFYGRPVKVMVAKGVDDAKALLDAYAYASTLALPSSKWTDHDYTPLFQRIIEHLDANPANTITIASHGHHDDVALILHQLPAEYKTGRIQLHLDAGFWRENAFHLQNQGGTIHPNLRLDDGEAFLNVLETKGGCKMWIYPLETLMSAGSFTYDAWRDQSTKAGTNVLIGQVMKNYEAYHGGKLGVGGGVIDSVIEEPGRADPTVTATMYRHQQILVVTEVDADAIRETYLANI